MSDIGHKAFDKLCRWEYISHEDSRLGGERQERGVERNGELLRSFYLHCQAKNLRPRTIKDYADRLEYLLRFSGERTTGLVNLTRHDLTEYIVSIIGTLSPVTVNGRLTIFKLFYNHLEDVGLLSGENPTTKLHRVRVDIRPKPILTSEQLSVLLNSFDRTSFAGARNWLMVVVSVDGCLRVGELNNLRLENCPPSQSMLLVVESKTRQYRYIPICETSLTAINEWRTAWRDHLPGEYLFCYENGDGPLEHDRFRKLLCYQEDRGLGFHINPHMLRRTGASHLHRNGADIETISRVLGHSDIRTTRGYINIDLAFLRETANKYSVINDLKLGLDEKRNIS